MPHWKPLFAIPERMTSAGIKDYLCVQQMDRGKSVFLSSCPFLLYITGAKWDVFHFKNLIKQTEQKPFLLVCTVLNSGTESRRTHVGRIVKPEPHCQAGVTFGSLTYERWVLGLQHQFRGHPFLLRHQNLDGCSEHECGGPVFHANYPITLYTQTPDLRKEAGQGAGLNNKEEATQVKWLQMSCQLYELRTPAPLAYLRRYYQHYIRNLLTVPCLVWVSVL